MDGIQSFPEIVKLLIENGLQATLTLFFLTLIFGLILGMIIAKGRMSKLLIIQMPIRFFLLIMRGTPLILQLYRGLHLCHPVQRTPLLPAQSGLPHDPQRTGQRIPPSRTGSTIRYSIGQRLPGIPGGRLQFSFSSPLSCMEYASMIQ